MTVKLTLKQFCQRLVESGLMTAEEILALRKRYPSAQRPSTADTMARELILKNKLTSFQAARIFEGRHEPLLVHVAQQG